MTNKYELKPSEKESSLPINQQAINIAVHTLAGPLNKDKEILSIVNLWIEGNTIHDIASKINKSPVDVSKLLSIGRHLISDLQKEDLVNNLEERIIAIRNLIKTHWILYKASVDPKLLQEIHKLERTLGQLQGVLQENKSVVYSGSIEHKLYTFTDKTPPPIISEGSFKELPDAG
jgi:hypothetical protein